jgi:D-aminoacyl-tRNA deacylase
MLIYFIPHLIVFPSKGGVSGISSKETENEKVTIVISNEDPASQNIKDMLQQIRDWNPIKVDCEKVITAFEFKRFRLVEIKGLHIYQDGLDRQLKACGLDSDILIFASRHSGKDGRQILTVHPTGNTKEAEYGGHPMELAAAAAQAMRSIFLNLKTLTKNEDFEVTLESTHHGPSDLKTPSIFVEIGSSEQEWVDPVAGHIVANAILMLDNENVPVAVGFGGNHYAPRQTKLIEETNVAFGHIFPTYKLDDLDETLVRQAFDRSCGDIAYLDRKSMSARQRDRLIEIIEGLGYDILRESDIREMDGVPWQFCLELRKKVNDICPQGRTRITKSIKSDLKTACRSCVCPKVKVATISPELLSEAEKVDRTRLRDFLDTYSIAYLEHRNGSFSHTIIGIDDDCARLVAEELTNECINILKEHYNIRYEKDEGILYLITNKFSPALARELGITSGPLFGALARGEVVTVDDRTVNPEMVYEIVEKPIRINNIYIY